jgi:hypothetical protein
MVGSHWTRRTRSLDRSSHHPRIQSNPFEGSTTPAPNGRPDRQSPEERARATLWRASRPGPSAVRWVNPGLRRLKPHSLAGRRASAWPLRSDTDSRCRRSHSHSRNRTPGASWGVKRVLRRVLSRYLPSALFERPKQGFAVPVAQWLRGELRTWAEDLLSAQRLQTQGLFNVPEVRKVWAQHLDGAYNWDTRLWSLLMLQSWLEQRSAV